MRQRPAGTAGLLATALILLLSQLGVDLPADAAVAIVGLVGAAVSIFTPRLIQEFHLTPEAVDYLIELEHMAFGDHTPEQPSDEYLQSIAPAQDEVQS